MNQDPNRKCFIRWSILILAGFLFSFTAGGFAANNRNLFRTTGEMTVNAGNEQDTLDKVVHTIIGIAANDFFRNQKPAPVHFRNVQLKSRVKPDGETLYILCGQFQTKEKYPFGYEHLASLIRVADLAVKKSDDQKGEAGHDGISGPGLAG